MKKPDWKIWIKEPEECRLWLQQYLRNEMLHKKMDESQLYMKKADHNLTFANWILEKHTDEIPVRFAEETFYDWVVSIYYYAIYHSALSLLSKEGYASKSHLATLCFIIYHHYHERQALNHEDVELLAQTLTKKDIETIGISKELRERASYDVHASFEKVLAGHARENAVNFVNKIKEIL